MSVLSLDSLRQDARQAMQALRRSRGFTLLSVLSVLTLALGIGANTAMFSVLNGILLRELPVRDQQSVVVM